MSARMWMALVLLLVAWVVCSAQWPAWTLLVALALAAQGARMVRVELVESVREVGRR